MLTLRAHHILCLHGFRGYGYSDGFTSNMRSIHQALKDDPHVMVQVIAAPDGICAACPRLQDGRCSADGEDAETRISAMDTAVTHRMNITPGDVYKASALFELASDIFAHGIAEICPSCRWHATGWCEEGIRDRFYNCVHTPCERQD